MNFLITISIGIVLALGHIHLSLASRIGIGFAVMIAGWIASYIIGADPELISPQRPDEGRRPLDPGEIQIGAHQWILPPEKPTAADQAAATKRWFRRAAAR